MRSKLKDSKCRHLILLFPVLLFSIVEIVWLVPLSILLSHMPYFCVGYGKS